MWYLLCLEILHSQWVSSLFLQKVAVFLLSLHSDLLNILEKREDAIVQMVSNNFVILEINL